MVSLASLRQIRRVASSNRKAMRGTPRPNADNCDTTSSSTNHPSCWQRCVRIVVNQIEDITSISNLINIEYLGLSNNQVSDISSLSNLSNLTYLNLLNNPLNIDAYNIYLPQIISNNPGIKIYYDPIPEPTTLSLLALGSLATFYRRKRK
jgi:hypothetical protein